MRKQALPLVATFLALTMVLAVPLPADRAAEAAVTPRALLVLAFAPGESLRSSCVSDLQETVRTLWEFGFDVEILDAYNESGGIIPCPHYQLHQRVDGKSYNLLIYYGHGDASRWAFHLPQDAAWAGQTGTPQGWDEARLFGDYRNHWAEEIRLAPGAMVVMRHTCFSTGVEALDLNSGAGLLPQSEVMRRINEYSYTFLHPSTAIGSYTATAIVGGTPAYLRNLFKNYATPIAELTVPDLSTSFAAGSGYQFITGAHYYLGGYGITYRKNRFPGSTNRDVWSQPAWAGDPGLTAKEVFGVAPGDKNGDGDNTDLGEPCFPHDSRDVFKAEDTSYNFFPFVCIANPNDASTWAEVTFCDEQGEYLTIYREVPGDARITIDCNANRYLRDRNLSVRVRSVDGTPLLAERPMYFRYCGWMDGGSDAFGSRQSNTTWYFAEGYTSDAGPFQEYICLGNFGTRTASGTMTLMPLSGDPVEVDLSVAAGARRTYCINSYVKGEVAVKVETDQPVVAERSVYFRYAAMNGGFIADGGHTKPGISALSSQWYFAEGHVSEDFEEWISLANPAPEAAEATVTFVTPAGKRGSRRVVLPPRSRRSVLVNESFATASDVSVVVDSDRPIACERVMYFDYNGGWDDGHVSPGNTRPARKWMFAEGSVYPGIHEYVLLVNPGDEVATVRATYMLGPGEGTHAEVYTVGARSRATVSVNSELAAFGSPSQVALELTSDQPIACERVMYFDMGRGSRGREPIQGGHVSMGVSSASVRWFFAEMYTGR
ncbi:MAG: hypothetical protein AB1384_08590 [Actinomycetota bacterium]